MRCERSGNADGRWRMVMADCEKCWAESRRAHRRIMREGAAMADYRRRVKMHACAPEQSAGPDAEFCGKCLLWTMHQHTKACVICGDVREKTRDLAELVRRVELREKGLTELVREMLGTMLLKANHEHPVSLLWSKAGADWQARFIALLE